jgi:hypothetical protein
VDQLIEIRENYPVEILSQRVDLNPFTQREYIVNVVKLGIIKGTAS